MKLNATVKTLMRERETLTLVDWRNGFSNGGNFLELHREGKIIELGDYYTYSPGADMSTARLSELRRQVIDWLDCVVDLDDRDEVIREATEVYDAIICHA